MKAAFFLKDMGPFEQDVTVTETVTRDVPIEEGDEVIVQVRARVSRIVGGKDCPEVDLRDLRPVKIVQVLRPKGARGG